MLEVESRLWAAIAGRYFAPLLFQAPSVLRTQMRILRRSAGVLAGSGLALVLVVSVVVAHQQTRANIAKRTVHGLVLYHGHIQLHVTPVPAGRHPLLPNGGRGITASRAIMLAARNQRKQGVRVDTTYGLFTDPFMGKYNARGQLIPFSRNRPVWVVSVVGLPHLPDPREGVFNNVLDARTGRFLEGFSGAFAPRRSAHH